MKDDTPSTALRFALSKTLWLSKDNMSPTARFVLEHAKAGDAAAILAIAEASLNEERLSFNGNHQTWCESLYQMGEGAVWQKVLHAVLTTNFTEERWAKKREEWHRRHHDHAGLWMEQACAWKDAQSVGLLLSRFNSTSLSNPDSAKRENIWNTHMRDLFVKPSYHDASVLPWHGWWRLGEKAWDGTTKSRHFKDFLSVMNGVFKSDQNYASFPESMFEAFTANLFRHAHRQPATKEWMDAWSRNQPWSSKMASWVEPILEICLKSKEHEEQAWSDLSTWFNLEGLKTLREYVGRRLPTEISRSFETLSQNLARGVSGMPAALNRVERVLSLSKRMGVEAYLRGPEAQTKVFQKWVSSVEEASRGRSAKVMEKHMPQVLAQLQETESFFDPQFLASEWRRPQHEKTKALLWGLENRVLLLRSGTQKVVDAPAL